MNNYYLAGELSFTLTDEADLNRRYCIFIGSRVFHGSHAVMQLLQAINQVSDIAGITGRMNAGGSSRVVTEQDVRDVIGTRLIPAGIVSVAATAAEEPPKAPRYLFFERTIFTASMASAISRPFVHLFHRKVALCVLLVCMALLGGWVWNCWDVGTRWWSPLAGFDMTLSESVLFYGLLLASFLFHELGHAAASRRFGAMPAEIGFGLYLLFPVFYCNVTESWRLPRLQRIVVSTGGVYFQLLASALLVPFQLYFDSDVLTLVIAANLAAIFVTLNPFFRFDGYWIYSDFFAIPNLRDRSRELMAAAARAISFPASSVRNPQATLALRVYAAGSAAFFAGFSVVVVQATWDIVTSVPSMLRAAAAKFEAAPGLESAVDIAAGSVTYLLYLVACTLTSMLVVSAVLRFAKSVSQQWRKSDKQETAGAAPHV